MIINIEQVLGPEDILEMDILLNLPNSAGYQIIVTMIDVISRYLFEYPTQDVTAKQSVDSTSMYYRRHDETCILTNTNTVRQRLTIPVKRRRRDNRSTKIQTSRASTKHSQTIGY